MTKPEMIEAIRKAAIKANPEIVELKFGCVIYPNYFVVESYGQEQEEKGLGILCLDRDSGFLARVSFYENDMYEREIIGRDIGLADVLMMIEHNWRLKSDGMGDVYKIDLINDQKVLGELRRLRYWDLTKPLYDQSEETIRFIFNLIPK